MKNLEHIATVIIDSSDVNKIFDLAKEYFPNQGFKWSRESKPIMLVYKRGGIFGITTKGIKTTLTVSFRPEGIKTKIDAHYQLPSGIITEGSRKIYTDEINEFKNFVDSLNYLVQPPLFELEEKSSELFINCPECGKEVSPDFSVCPFCAISLKAENKCEKCGKELSPEFAVCPFCGTPK